MKKSSVVWLIVAGLILFVLGAGLGMFYQQQKTASQINEATALLQKDKSLQTAAKVLSSKVVPVPFASGKVIAISGKNVTLSNNGDSLVVKISDNADISSFVRSLSASGQITITQPKTDFSSIKIGDDLHVSLKLLPDGQIEGQSATIFPPLPTNQGQAR